MKNNVEEKRPDKEKRLTKVATFQIVKPVNMSWSEFGKMLRDVRYRLSRLANMAVSEAYQNLHQRYRLKNQNAPKSVKIGQISRDLRKILLEEGLEEENLSKYSKMCVLPDTITGAFSRYKLSTIDWRKVLTGKISIPNYKANLSIPIRCDKPQQRRLERTETGEIEVDLMICNKPYPRVLLSTRTISDGQRSVLERLVLNNANSLPGYRHRIFEIKEKRNEWYLSVTYDFPKAETTKLHSDIIVGVDLGWSVPLYAAINNGYARIGYKQLKPLGDSIKALQRQTIARRRSIQRGGTQDLAAPTARSGHGIKRILQPIEKLEGKIDNAYKTLNHQLSHCVIEFAKNHGAGVIQIENLKGLAEELSGTFIGQNWRYYQLQEFIKYKAKEAGIIVKEVNPFYTSRRCSECGYIHKDFTFEYRQANRKNGKSTMFECPKKEEKGCKPLNADYNAARNLATSDIEDKIRLQCKEQGIEYKEIKEK
jgi:IS605 OrfB family transposase